MNKQKRKNMKQLLLTIAFIFIGLTAVTAQDSYSLTINFTGMESDKGAVFIGVHNTKEGFLKKRYKEAVVKITDNKATVVFEGLPKGEYAVSAFHDENDNKKMDTNFIGIPKEPIGISNDAKGFMGPPKYKDAKFTITENTAMVININ